MVLPSYSSMHILPVRSCSHICRDVLRLTHAPAHEGRMQHRLANLAKIKVKVTHLCATSPCSLSIQAELEVDDFLPPDDPRKESKGSFSRLIPLAFAHSLTDPTDRFDFTFLCGDLNFRLDITRLHADWLISRKGEDQTALRLSSTHRRCLRVYPGARLRPAAQSYERRQ